MNEYATAQAVLKAAHRPVVFTGAGMSAESGVPTFRGAQGGLWRDYDAARLATPEAYHADKALVWGWYVWRMAQVRRAVPHTGHLALTRLQTRWPDLMIVTQNVDDLHERAGSQQIVHLHGNIFAHRCAVCAHPCPDWALPEDAAERHQLCLEPPRCGQCGGSIRPGVVWFGESLPQTAWQQARDACSRADVMVVVGTSGVVQPAASLVSHAEYSGAKILEINPDTSTHSSVAHIHLRASAASALAQLAECLGV